MDIIIERACGMDVHKDSITACVMTPEGQESLSLMPYCASLIIS